MSLKEQGQNDQTEAIFSVEQASLDPRPSPGLHLHEFATGFFVQSWVYTHLLNYVPYLIAFVA
ncbi:MAG TPA: hypothetical protein V6D20_06405, partial [Candidatus Obscuribacterales bacterium]